MKSMVICSFLLKKPFPIVLLAIFCLSQGIAQERKRITNHDENGTIISAGEIDVYDDKIDTVWVRRFDSNGTKIEEKKFKNGELNGAWKGWYSNRSKKYRIRYKNGVTHGTSEHFDSTGLTIIQKKYKNGTLHGKQREWYSNGELLKVIIYELGVINGIYNEWWNNGEKMLEGQYKDGKKRGQWTYYDAGRRLRYDFYRRSGEFLASYNFKYYANGQIKEEPSFVNGKADGIWLRYSEGGNKIRQLEYLKGRKHGTWIKWWENGEKKEEGLYLGNKKEEQWTYYDSGRRSRYNFYRSDELLASYDFEYYANGQLKEEPSFNKDGLWEGDWIRYFEGGEKASQRGYGNGRPDGIWISWHDSTFVKVQEMTYKDSLLEDNYFEWWMDEKPKVTGFYVHGKKDSKWSYWDKFAHQRFEMYEMGELTLKWGWEYYDNNQVKEEFVYIKTGILHGEWYAYHEDGSHKGFRVYNDGLRGGAWIDWYTNGQKSFERKYELDQPVDKWFYWYFFGELMSEVQYENNEIVGQQCFQSSFMYSKPDEELGDCSTIFDLGDFEHGVFRLYSSSKVLIKETFINDNELLAQFEYHDNSEPSTIKLFRQGEIIFFKRWNPEGIEIIDDPDPSGLFSSWDYYLNGNVKYKVTYMGIEKKEKHGIEWSYYNDRTWEQINLFYRGELQLSRKWTHGAPISVDTLYQDGKKVFAIKADVQEK